MPNTRFAQKIRPIQELYCNAISTQQLEKVHVMI